MGGFVKAKIIIVVILIYLILLAPRLILSNNALFMLLSALKTLELRVTSLLLENL